jgi:dipeptidase D
MINLLSNIAQIYNNQKQNKKNQKKMKVLKLFKEISSIPRCSKNHQPFIKYIKQFATQYGFDVQVDDAFNILCKKNNSKATICLQSHYDIVCLKDNDIPQIYEDNGYLKATNTTLGADNGIGCAYMLALMQEQIDCEYLFTSDEEIGLIGANNINLKLQSKYMLNLDSEEQNKIAIGCAGGIDIKANFSHYTYINNTQNKKLFQIEIDTKQGGHSGVDIDKNIPNSLKLLANIIKKYDDADIVDINGGERINSIPRYAKAIIASNKILKPLDQYTTITQLQTSTQTYKKFDNRLLDLLYSFPNGIRAYDKNLNIVLDSINLAQIQTKIDTVEISFSARSMDNENLDNLALQTLVMLENFGCEAYSYGRYPAWYPQTNQFVQKVQDIYNQHSKDVKLYAIHAGLECAILNNKFPHMQICSIGPNIYFPHSKDEKCQIDSVIKVYKIIQQITKGM